jgi:hypothetical protein
MTDTIKLFETLRELVDAVESYNKDPWYEDRITDALDHAHHILDNKEVQELRELCATAYQVVGAASGPVELLDNLSAASNGECLPHNTSAGLPWTVEDSEKEWKVLEVTLENPNFDYYLYTAYNIKPRRKRLTIVKETYL